jgi:hypothetical protein
MVSGNFCLPCKWNTYSSSPGSTNCQICPRGHHTNNITCEPCPPGTAGDSGSYCWPCSGRSYSSSPGSLSCSYCYDYDGKRPNSDRLGGGGNTDCV